MALITNYLELFFELLATNLLLEEMNLISVSLQTDNARWFYTIEDSIYDNYFSMQNDGSLITTQLVILPSRDITAFNVSCTYFVTFTE